MYDIKSVDRLLLWVGLFFILSLGAWATVSSQQATAESVAEDCLICTDWMPCQGTNIGHDECVQWGDQCGGTDLCGCAGTSCDQDQEN